jgi:hypothetical protein
MGDTYCSDHLGEACAVCAGQATHNCSQQGPMAGPCGFPLCGKHRCQESHDKKWHE